MVKAILHRASDVADNRADEELEAGVQANRATTAGESLFHALRSTPKHVQTAEW